MVIACGQGASKVTLNQASAQQVGDLLQIDIKPIAAESYNGYYEQKTVEGKKVLHGDFLAKYKQASSEGTSKIEIAFRGKFDNGNKVGPLINRVTLIDGNELYQDYTAALVYKRGKASCDSATFSGVLNDTMKPERYRFKDLTNCSFINLVGMAKQAYEKEKK